MNYSRVFLGACFLTAIVMLGLYAAVFNYQFGAPIPAEYELPKWIMVKEDIADKSGGNRVFLTGDSNVLFGMDSEYATKELGRSVINFGLHGSLPLDWGMTLVSKHARQGDVVVMSLNWKYYLLDYREPSSWLVDQTVAWGGSYFEGLSFIRKVKFAMSVSPSVLYRNVTTKKMQSVVLAENPLRLVPPREKVLEIYYKLRLQHPSPYSYINIGSHGDMQKACGVQYDVSDKGYDINSKSMVNKHSLSLVLDTIKSLEAKGVKVYVVAPVQADNAITRGAEHLAGINKIWSTLASHNVHLLGRPTSYYFSSNAFFDSVLHLNCESALSRTKILVEDLRTVM